MKKSISIPAQLNPDTTGLKKQYLFDAVILNLKTIRNGQIIFVSSLGIF